MEIKVFDPRKKIVFFEMHFELKFLTKKLPYLLQLRLQQLLLPFVVFEHQPKFEQFFDVLLDQYV
jgi:hypothetical protein